MDASIRPRNQTRAIKWMQKQGTAKIAQNYGSKKPLLPGIKKRRRQRHYNTNAGHNLSASFQGSGRKSTGNEQFNAGQQSFANREPTSSPGSSFDNQPDISVDSVVQAAQYIEQVRNEYARSLYVADPYIDQQHALKLADDAILEVAKIAATVAPGSLNCFPSDFGPGLGVIGINSISPFNNGGDGHSDFARNHRSTGGVLGWGNTLRAIDSGSNLNNGNSSFPYLSNINSEWGGGSFPNELLSLASSAHNFDQRKNTVRDFDEMDAVSKLRADDLDTIIRDSDIDSLLEHARHTSDHASGRNERSDETTFELPHAVQQFPERALMSTQSAAYKSWTEESHFSNNKERSMNVAEINPNNTMNYINNNSAVQQANCSSVQVVFDMRSVCSFDNNSAETVMQGMSLLYQRNLVAKPQLHLYFMNFPIGCQMDNHMLNINFDKWDVEQSADDLFSYFSKDELIYLSPHSSTVLAKLDSTKVYVINANYAGDTQGESESLEVARSMGIPTARLPILDVMNGRCPLSNTVVPPAYTGLMLLQYLETKCWKTSVSLDYPSVKYNPILGNQS